MDWRAFRIRWTAVVCVFLLVCAPVLPARSVRQESQGTTPQAEPAKIPNDQLDALVAPIALYPDPMLAQVLAASTYPLELIQLQQWLSKNPKLKDKALTESRSETAVGCKRTGHGRPSRRRQAAHRRHSVDHRSGKCRAGSTIRRNGCRATHEGEGPRKGQPQEHRTAKSGNQGGGVQASHRHPASEPRSRLRAQL